MYFFYTHNSLYYLAYNIQYIRWYFENSLNWINQPQFLNSDSENTFEPPAASSPVKLSQITNQIMYTEKSCGRIKLCFKWTTTYPTMNVIMLKLTLLQNLNNLLNLIQEEVCIVISHVLHTSSMMSKNNKLKTIIYMFRIYKFPQAYKLKYTKSCHLYILANLQHLPITVLLIICLAHSYLAI